MTRALLVLLVLASASADRLAHGGEPETARLRRAFAFTGQLLGRRLTLTGRSPVFQGDAAFRLRDPRAFKAVNYENDEQPLDLATGLMSPSRDVVELATIYPFPINPESRLIKVKTIRNRECNINYNGSNEESGFDTLVEGPGGDPAVAAIYLGGGLWVGYFHARELPPVDVLLAEPWISTPTGGAVCHFGDRRIEIAFDPDNPDRPRTIEITPAAKGLEKNDDSYIHSRVIELGKWANREGVEFPGEVSFWDLYMNSKTGWMSSYMVFEIVSVGPVEKVSDRYGDFFSDVPNGAPVQVDDYLGIEFEWRDGEIVRKVDGVKLASLVGQPFFGSPLRRYLLMALGLGVLAAAAWFAWRRPFLR
jgi:hypothetical protein